jgi:hypothetical protein
MGQKNQHQSCFILHFEFQTIEKNIILIGCRFIHNQLQSTQFIVIQYMFVTYYHGAINPLYHFPCTKLETHDDFTLGPNLVWYPIQLISTWIYNWASILQLRLHLGLQT